MPSPFPGMDPYIEACGLWEDFHHLLIAKIYETIAPLLPQGYTVRSGVRSYIVLMETEGKDENLARDYFCGAFVNGKLPIDNDCSA